MKLPVLRFALPMAIAGVWFTFSAAAQIPEEQFHVVPQAQLDQWWHGDPRNAAPKYPVQALRDRAEGCMAVAFVIHADGSTTPTSILKEAWSSAPSGTRKLLEQSVVLTLAHVRYLPAQSNNERDPVYTYGVSTFQIEGDGKTKAEIESKCEVPDFMQQVQQRTRSAGGKS